MDRFDVVVFEDNNGTRFIYCDAAVAAISAPMESGKVHVLPIGYEDSK